MKHVHEWYKDEETDQYVHIASVHVDASVEQCFRDWWAYNIFPQFMTHITQSGKDAPHAGHWEAEVAGRHVSWDAVSEMVPNESISWHSTHGLRNSGVIRFAEEDHGSLIIVKLMYDPPFGIIGDLVASRRVNDQIHAQLVEDLHRFKEAVESGLADDLRHAA